MTRTDICQARARERQKITHPQTDRKKINKPVLCVETGVVYKSIKDAARQLNAHHILISKVCRGLRKTTLGLHFKFADKEETH